MDDEMIRQVGADLGRAILEFVTMAGTSLRELKGREVDLIAAYRGAVKKSPPCQFVGHGGKLAPR